MQKLSLKIAVFILIIPLFVQAEKTSDIVLRYRLSGTVGWLNRDDKISGTKTMIGLTMDRPVVTGTTFSVEFLPTGKWKSLTHYNNASVGLALTWLNLGQDEYLGNLIIPYAYVRVPFVRTQHFEFGLKPGLGVAFATKRYSNTIPDEYKWKAYQVNKQQIANISIGSIANAFINGGLYFDFPIRDGWSVYLDGGWQHVSNGSVLVPNAGYNMFNAEIGVSYCPAIANHSTRNTYQAPLTDVPHHMYDGVTKKWDIEILAGGGMRSVYYADKSIPDNQTLFGCASVGISAHWKPLSIFRIGAGFDMYYDGAYSAVCDEFAPENPGAPITKFGKTYLAESKVSNCFRVGFSLQPELILGKLSLGYHMGFYIYDPIKNLEPFAQAQSGELNRSIFYRYDPSRASTYQDGWFYQKLQLKYLCTKHMFVHLGLKLHIMKAEFIDAGLGIRI